MGGVEDDKFSCQMCSKGTLCFLCQSFTYAVERSQNAPFVFLFLQLITVYTVPGMDPDWLIGERGNEKGKVPVTYLELLS